MRKMFICLYVCIFSLSLSVLALAGEEVVINETIIKMVKANLGEEVIISKIKKFKD